jgi:hypothetical protein
LRRLATPTNQQKGKEIAMAQPVTTFKPVDVGGVKDDGIKSLVLLAASLGYKYDWRSGKPITLFAADQTQISLSTETSINAGVFQSKLNHIMTHYDAYHYSPTIELIDSIIKQCKPNKDQQRLLRLAVGETIEQTRKRMAAQEAGPATQKRHPDEHLTQRIEVPTSDESPLPHVGGPVVEPPKSDYVYKPHEVRFGPVSDDGVYYFYNSETVVDRFDATGAKTYVCRYCHEHGRPDYVVVAPAGIGVHWGRHVKAGETVKTDRQKHTQRSDGVPVAHHQKLHTRKRKQSQPGTTAHRQKELDKLIEEAQVHEAEVLATIDALIEERNDEATEVPEKVADAPDAARFEHIEGAMGMLTPEQKIWAIRNIIDDGQVEWLQNENVRLATRVASLESDLRALKDLIGGIK